MTYSQVSSLVPAYLHQLTYLKQHTLKRITVFNINLTCKYLADCVQIFNAHLAKV
jgi:hypothetical protein